MVTASIRAGDVILTTDPPSRMSARNVIPAAIEEIHTLSRGGRVLVYCDVGERLMVEITRGALEELALRPGMAVHLIIKANSIWVHAP